MLEFDDDPVIHMPITIQTTAPEAVKMLEQVRQRRREELAGWQPSAGWLAQRNVARPTHSGTRTSARWQSAYRGEDERRVPVFRPGQQTAFQMSSID